jgi:HEAT repeat protein
LAAAKVMGVLMLEPEQTVPELIRALKSEGLMMQLFAAQALGRIGPAARTALPTLNQLTTAGDIYLRREAAWAIQMIQADEKKTDRESGKAAPKR